MLIKYQGICALIFHVIFSRIETEQSAKAFYEMEIFILFHKVC